jgi:hypothetical protein
VLDEYTSEQWSKAVGDTKLAEYVRKYQDPKQADTIMKMVWVWSGKAGGEDRDEGMSIANGQLWCLPFVVWHLTAQDDRVRPGARREAGQPR